MFFGKHLFSKIAGKGKLYCHLLNDSFWGSMKSAGFVFKNEIVVTYYDVIQCYNVISFHNTLTINIVELHGC